MRSIPTGSTDVTMYFVMRDSTNHAPKTDATITNIDVYYQEQGAAQSAKADLTALAAADSAHADNKGYHCGNGLYRIDWPDAAFDGGAGKSVILVVVCTGCDTIYREVQLISATRGLAGTALPDAAANAAGGLPVSSGGGLALDTKLGYLQAAITSTILGRIDAAISTRSSHDAAAVKTAVEAAGSHLTLIKAKTDNLPDSPAAVGSNMGTVSSVTGNVGGSVASVTAGVSLAADAVSAAALKADAVAEIADGVWDEIISGHSGAGSTGAALAAAGGSGDPWSTALPGAYGSGTAGKIIGDNINAPIGTVDTVVDAIKAVTDAIGATGSGLSAVPWNAAWDAEVQSECTDAITAASLPTAAQIKTAIEAAGSHLTLIKTKTDNIPASPAAVGSAMALADDAITAAKFDESTAFPLKSADTGATAVARTGADSDTLETLSNEIAAVKADTGNIVTDTNELQTDWHDGGRLDLILDAAGSAGDPWSTALPGAYGAGTAGKIVGDNLNAPVGTVDTVVDAIKAVTDNLPDSGALTTIDGKIDTIDANVDSVLEDTGTTLDGKLDTIDGIVDSILEDTGTTLPATLSTIDGIVDDILVDTAEIGAAGAGLTAVPWNAAWDAEVQSECADALTAYDPPTKAELDSAQAAIVADTEDLQTQVGTAGAGLTAVPWNAAWDAEVQSECADALTAYDPPTKAELDSAHATTDGKIDTVDANVDSILEDTGTTLPAAITALTEAGIKKNAALSGFTFYMTDSTNHVASTGLTVTAERSLDGAAFAACANAVTELSDGCYSIDLATTDLNGDVVVLKFTATDTDDLVITIRTSA